MKKCLLTSLIFLIEISIAFSIENYPTGARALGLSNAFVSFSDTWSIFHNQAGLANLTTVSAGVFYESLFQIDELSLVAGSLVLPSNSGNFGVSFSQFGKGTFKENKFGLAFAKQLGDNFFAGIQLDYFAQTFPENEHSKGFATFEGGIIYQPTEKLFLGGHIFNPILGGINSPSGKIKMPAVFRFGGHYRFSDSVLMTLETEKDTGNPFILKTGIEYLPVENLALRIGVSGNPVHFTAGMGYNIKNISADFGFSYHGNLGITPSVSVQFRL